MNMKEKIYYLLFAVLMALFCTACNEEWTDEQYEHYVSFKAPMDYARGVTDIYVKYKLNGAVTYQLPVIMSGSTLPGHDTEVQIAIDSDTLKSINWEYFHNRTDLYYKELTSDYYEVENMNVVIPADDCVGLLNVNFKLGGIDLVDKWVLPLTIRESPIGSYTPHPRKNYKKALLRVVPFNDYSGIYSTTTMEVGFTDSGTKMTTNTRTAFVVDEHSVFFYAGLMNEEELELLEPFGKGNTKPVFAARDVTLLGARILGKNRNVLKLQVQDVNGCRIEAMLFHHADDFLGKLEEQYGKTEVEALLKGRGRQIRISMTYYPDINEYMGEKTPQIVVTHYR